VNTYINTYQKTTDNVLAVINISKILMDITPLRKEQDICWTTYFKKMYRVFIYFVELYIYLYCLQNMVMYIRK